MIIAIPTYMREDHQKAYESIPESIRKQAVLISHSGRQPVLRKHQPKAEIFDLGKTDGIADVRQKLIEAVGAIDDKVFIIDDKVQFMTSEIHGDGQRRPANTWIRGDRSVYLWERMLDTVEGKLEEYPQVGISSRPGNNRRVDPWQSPGRAYSVYGVNIPWVNRLGVRFDGMYRKDPEIRLYEDFYFTLALLTRGVPNLIWWDYCFQTTHGRDGGNNTIRTNALQRKCAEALAAEFPAYVKVVQRETKTFKLGDDPYRWDVRVQWKRALTDAQEKELL